MADSLKLEIDRHPREDTALVDMRNAYVRYALFADPGDNALMAYVANTQEMARQLRYARGVLQSQERMGLIYQYAYGDPYRALDHYQQALRIADADAALQPYAAGIIGNMGNIYYEQEEYEKALSYFRRALSFRNEMELAATANIGNIFGSIGQHDSAVHYLSRTVGLARQSSNWMFLANGLSSLSLIYGRMGRADDAVNAIEESLAIIDRYDIGYVRTTAYVNAAMAYQAKNDLRRAERLALAAQQLEQSSDNANIQKSIWGTLADIYEAQHRYREALDARKRYEGFKDSLNNQNRRVEINRKQLQFDFEKQQTLAQAEIRRQSTIKKAVITGGGGLALALVLGFVWYKRRRDVVTRQREAEFRALVSDTELKALRSQMNPHFIFNALNSINDYVAKNNREAAREYLTKFAKLMRQTLENTDRRTISLAEDLEFVELYLQMESKRLDGRFSYVIHVDESVDSDNTLVPPMLLQPFIENSIWHGFATTERHGLITILIRQEKEMLICHVEDNGGGLRPGRKVDKQPSRGIQLTENRLAIWAHGQQARGTLDIRNKTDGSGVLVRISLPLQLDF